MNAGVTASWWADTARAPIAAASASSRSWPAGSNVSRSSAASASGRARTNERRPACAATRAARRLGAPASATAASTASAAPGSLVSIATLSPCSRAVSSASRNVGTREPREPASRAPIAAGSGTCWTRPSHGSCSSTAVPSRLPAGVDLDDVGAEPGRGRDALERVLPRVARARPVRDDAGSVTARGRPVRARRARGTRPRPARSRRGAAGSP